MTEMTKEQRKKELAKYAADLTQIYKYLNKELGSRDPYHKAYTIYNELDRTINKLVNEIKEKY